LLSLFTLFVAQLLEFGFTQVRAEKALVLTQNRSIEAAMDWLTLHENDADIDQPLQVVGSAPAPAQSSKTSAAALLAQVYHILPSIESIQVHRTFTITLIIIRLTPPSRSGSPVSEVLRWVGKKVTTTTMALTILC
jgi:hypothetical protein